MGQSRAVELCSVQGLMLKRTDTLAHIWRRLASMAKGMEAQDIQGSTERMANVLFHF